MVPVTKERPPEYKDTFIDKTIPQTKLIAVNRGFSERDSSGSLESDSEDEADSASSPFSFYKLWKYTGPGWLMSIAYLDPGNSKLQQPFYSISFWLFNFEPYSKFE